MKKALIIIVVILLAAALLAILGYFYWGWFGGDSADTSDYNECLAANKAKADGEACNSCVPERSAGPAFKGKIKNGECINVAEAIKYIVSNPQGAIIYNLSGVDFVGSDDPKKVPFNTEVSIAAISTDQKYANTSYGWMSISDISAV